MTHKMFPRLRFKEFHQKWERHKLQDISDRVSVGLATSVTEHYVEKGGEAVPIIRNLNIKDGYFDDSDMLFISKSFSELHPNKRVKKGDVITVHTGSNVGLTCVVPAEYHLAQTFTTLIVTTKHEELSPFFLSYLLSSAKGSHQALRLVVGGGKGNLNTNDFCLYPVFHPSLPEQQKIASFLSAVDEKIQQLTRKKELLEQYKKGVMQQLFSGKLRFKDENDKPYPKWEDKLFEEIYSFYSTNSLSREKLNYESGSVKNIHYGDIHTKFSSQFIVNEEYVPYINNEVDLSKIKDENYCREGDLVIADASEDYNDIGKSIELVKLNNEKVVAGLHTFLARPDLSKIEIGFSGYLVKAEYVRTQIKTIAQGTKVLSLSSGRLGKVKIRIPDKKEQQKIASFLTALDAKIESVAAQIAHTQTFKKGLLQQMFV